MQSVQSGPQTTALITRHAAALALTLGTLGTLGAFGAAQAQAPQNAPAPAATPATPIAPGLQPKSDPVTGSVDRLGWLVGCWTAKAARDGSTINEVWLAPRAGTLMGIGQTYAGARTTAWEAMRIFNAGEALKIWLRPGARNELTLDQDEGGARAVSFTLKEGTTTTSLRYERTNDTTLLATFRLTQGENRRGADFSFTKVDCSEMFAAAPVAAAAPAETTSAAPSSAATSPAPAK